MIYWITLKIYSGTFFISLGFNVLRILRITSFFFRMYEDLYFDNTWRIFSFSSFSFFVDYETNYPSIFEYWFTLYFYFYCIFKSGSCEAAILGLWKSGKILYFFGCCWWLTEMFSSNYFLLKEAFGMKSSVERTLLVPFRDGKLDNFSDDPLNSSGN